MLFGLILLSLMLCGLMPFAACPDPGACTAALSRWLSDSVATPSDADGRGPPRPLPRQLRDIADAVGRARAASALKVHVSISECVDNDNDNDNDNVALALKVHECHCVSFSGSRLASLSSCDKWVLHKQLSR